MEKRIELEKRGLAPDKIKDLILDNCRSTSIVGLTDEFVNLESLSLINVGLTSLKGFPKLPNLKRLELSDNRISSGLNVLHTSPQLASLNLSNNKIKELDVLKPLGELKSLQSLDLFNNAVTNIENYRDTIFNLLSTIKFLDGFDKENKEAEDSDDDEVNGNDDESDEADSEEESEDEVGLDAVYTDNLEEESDGGDYDGEEDEEDDDDDIDDEEDDAEEESSPRGKKRKVEDGGKEEQGSKKSNNGPAQ